MLILSLIFMDVFVEPSAKNLWGKLFNLENNDIKNAEATRRKGKIAQQAVENACVPKRLGW